MPEKKFFNRHMQLTMLNTSYPNSANASATPGFTEPLSTVHGLTNRWVSFRFDPAYPTDLTNLYAFANNQTTSTATGADGRGYNDSPFSLTVPQGVGTGQRIGRDISVIRDSWYFRWTFPRVIPGDAAQALLTPGTLNHQRFLPFCSVGSLTATNRDGRFADGYPHESFNLSQRPIRIRLVCIFEKECSSPGEFGWRTAELFESQFDIHSRFSSDQASGYKIVFDQTKTCTLMDNLGHVSNVALGADAQDDKSSAGPYEIRFKARIPPYLRRYEGNDSPDSTTGQEVTHTSSVVDGGVSKGALTWYVFIEDAYCPQIMDAAAPGTINTRTLYETPDIINVEVDRKTQWIDP